MGGNNKEALQRENTIRFIEAAEELIDEHGIDNVSVRKIAEKAGFHNSTIYLYFKDVNELILLASMKHFNEYSKALARLSSKNWDSTENFYFVWRFFVESMLKNPKIYLFDDSFSALDFKTDAKLRAALKNEVGESAVLIIAQRISSVQHADQILVMEDGRISAVGTHETLLRSSDIYREVYESQQKGEDDNA